MVDPPSQSRVVARVDGPRGEVVLRRRPVHEGADRSMLELRVNGVFVMDDAETSTERELARIALERCATPRTVLVGGLGLGFTLEEVLGDDRVEHVWVSEIEGAVIGWMRDGTVPWGPPLMRDARVQTRCEDVAATVASLPGGSLDLALLDVDNGPSYLVHDGNERLYGAGFLGALRRTLRPGGLVVVWSMTREEELLRALAAVFGDAEPVSYAVRLQDREEHYWLHVATAPPVRDRPSLAGSPVQRLWTAVGSVLRRFPV